ncbi:hypothetical protein BY458DRAFT_508501 [Sporodiniella umbellata]|nr:hypothetical protein BY458DRAFT_508501 [Sporodiniella umbellata]
MQLYIYMYVCMYVPMVCSSLFVHKKSCFTFSFWFSFSKRNVRIVQRFFLWLVTRLLFPLLKTNQMQRFVFENRNRILSSRPRR